MTIDRAVDLIQNCAQKMDAQYRKPVFDEWAIVSLLENKGRLLAYIGPRRTGFQQNFAADAGALRAGLVTKEYHPGDFEFARYGVGTGFESLMAVGRGIFLICNNTVQSMDVISRDPLWFGAQEPFVELSEKFRKDPLVFRADKGQKE